MGTFVRIDGQYDNKCVICGKHSRHYSLVTIEDPRDLKEVVVVVAHVACRKLVKKRDKLKKDLLNVEYDIYIRTLD